MNLATLDDLSIRISSDTADFIAGAEGVESKLGDLSSESLQTAAALEFLSNRADDAGDNISQAGNRASVTSGQFSGLAGATSAANASFMGISATTWGSLIPAVVALGAALAPVIGALGGFVAVAGSIAGVGLVPVIGAIATNTERLRRTFMGLVETIRTEFAPVFDMAGWSLQFLMEQFESIIPELVITQPLLGQIARNFEILGTTIIESLPAFVELATTLTTQFLPPFVDWLDNILPQLPGMIMGFVDVLTRMIPRFQEAGSVLMDILPPFTEFGFTVLNVLGPAMARFFEVGTEVLTFINQLDPAIQKSVAALSLLAPVIAVVGSLFSGPILAAGGALASLLAGPFLASLSTMAGVLPAVVGSLVAMAGVTANVLSFVIPFSGAISGLIGTLGGLVGSAAGVISTLGTIAALIGTGGIIVVAIAAVIAAFVRFQDEIRAVFDRVLPIISGAVNDALNWVQTNGPPLARKAMNALGGVIRTAALEIAAIFLPGRQSVILGALRDMTDWLIANAPGLLAKAWDALVSVSLAAWEGFKEGLIGNSIIPDTLRDVADFITGKGLSMAVGAVISWVTTVTSIYESAFNRIYNFAASIFSDLVGLINQGLDVLPSEITSELGFGDVGGLSVERRETSIGALQSQREEQIRVILDERTDIVEGRIEGTSRRVVNEESRAARRNTGTPSGVR